MNNPDRHNPGIWEVETGDHTEEFQVSPVSRVWIPRLAEIDATWNSKPWGEPSFEIELVNPAARVVGLFVSNSLIGYLVAHVVLDEAHIVSLGIAHDWRRRGAGSILLQASLKELRSELVSAVTLEVRSSNTAAQNLYKKFGFEPVGLRREYYTNNQEDAVIMRRGL